VRNILAGKEGDVVQRQAMMWSVPSIPVEQLLERIESGK
jgi:hypothetical protein